MFRKFLSVFAMSSILLVSASFSFGKTQSDWSAVENLVGQEVAIKVAGGNKHFGVVKSVDSETLVLKLAGKKTISQDEVSLKRSDIRKIWRALLYVNDRNTGKGFLIGAATGAVALGIPTVAMGNDDGLAPVGFIVGGVTGALIGGVTGFFIKSKHKKRDLVYKQ